MLGSANASSCEAKMLRSCEAKMLVRQMLRSANATFLGGGVKEAFHKIRSCEAKRKGVAFGAKPPHLLLE